MEHIDDSEDYPEGGAVILHVHQYGPPNQDKEQRWFFRFSLPALVKRKRRGRPAAIAKAFCAERTWNGETKCFWRAEDAALECDIWKLFLTRQYGVKGLEFSHASYEVFADVFRARRGSEVEDYINGPEVRTFELIEFLKHYDEILSRHASCAESSAWNPDIELHSARKKIEDIRAGACGDLTLAYARKEWAATWKDHCDLLADVDAYGVSKIEYEVKIKVDLLKKAIAAVAHFTRPEKGHRKFLPHLEKMDQDNKTLAEALKQTEETVAQFSTFKAMLAARTEELKKSKP